jgi:hypothetical protein
MCHSTERKVSPACAAEWHSGTCGRHSCPLLITAGVHGKRDIRAPLLLHCCCSCCCFEPCACLQFRHGMCPRSCWALNRPAGQTAAAARVFLLLPPLSPLLLFPQLLLLTASSFLPLLRPCIMMELVSLQQRHARQHTRRGELNLALSRPHARLCAITPPTAAVQAAC